MARESEKITRVDVRIPNEIYRQIEAIAIETNQPLHHRSGKPVITPIILNLINLGLEAVSQDDFNLESLTSKVSVNYRINIADIEQKLLASLENQLEELVEEKLPAIVSNTVERILKEQFKHLLEGSEIEAETEKPAEEVTPTLLDETPDKVRGRSAPAEIGALPTGTVLTGRKLAELMGVNATYPSKYKYGKITPPSWFWDNFEVVGEGNKSRWVKK